MDSAGLTAHGLAIFLGLCTLYCVERLGNAELSSIPTVGPRGYFSSYYGAVRFIGHAREMIQEGYEKFKGGVYKVPMVDRWVVVVTDPDSIDELRKKTEEELSFDQATKDLLRVEYTFGNEVQLNPYHAMVVRNQLTRRLADIFPAMHEEIVLAFNDVIPAQQNEWVAVTAYEAMMLITCRASNRIFIGEDLCREPELADIQANFALQVVMRATLMNFFPKILHPIIGRLLTNAPSSLQRCMTLLGSVVEERLRIFARDGPESAEMPDDVISWLIEVSKEEDRNARSVCLRILILNFASLHTSSQTFTHALYHLAVADPNTLTLLREEIQTVTDAEGWTKSAMSNLWRLDSFLKESQRVSGTSILPVVRKTMKTMTLSNGIVIPTHTHVAIATIPIHRDEQYYENADSFQPFRFVKSWPEGDEGSLSQQLVSTSSCYMAFGHGQRACPGRFFASLIMKTMMAHLVLHYDVKVEDGIRPPDQWMMMNCSPNRTAKVLFRKRQA
ncbi:cytochrome P450 [Coniophora puteana RWD-64-598 SS2]|uniref:Cytochrome P450 n=1 Tax=Coniophora puteana (strain RWD-64-598) TaxID=741705 RepID=A0A5M3N630_CONPW|nr:cytochrome P450 [Coniophora puteana RWD-64-598 SS2]EIW86892.1 cytochrome P450 [Coniophora puteana RWD-64-598 SS2]